MIYDGSGQSTGTAIQRFIGILWRAALIGASTALPLIAFEETGWRLMLVTGGVPALTYLGITYNVQQYMARQQPAESAPPTEDE